MTTPPNTTGKWTAELCCSDSWRKLEGNHEHWWDAAMALIADECAEWRLDPVQRGIIRDSDVEIIPDSREIRVGITDEPQAPETFFDGDWLIEELRSKDHDDYNFEGCGCEDWLAKVTPAQRDDLTGVLREGIRSWLDAHKLRPKWFVVRQSWTVTAGEARKMAKEKATQ